MVFLDETYRVLFVSSSQKYNDAVLPSLPSSDFYPVTVVSSVSEARQRLSETEYDIMLLNSPLPDDMGIELAMEVSQNYDTAVVLLVKSELYEVTYYQVLSSGVIVLSKPTNVIMIQQSMHAACALRERLRKMRDQQATVEKKIDEIRLINRAKWLLIECLNMTEQDAHDYIIRQAMELRKSKREIAENIIRTYQ